MLILFRKKQLNEFIKLVINSKLDNLFNDVKRINDLIDKNARLQRELTEKEIKMSGFDEKMARERRELEHMVGLDRKRVELEKDKAISDAKIQLREDLMTQKEADFNTRIEFMTKSFGEQMDYIKDMNTQILKRLPDISMKINKK